MRRYRIAFALAALLASSAVAAGQRTRTLAEPAQTPAPAPAASPSPEPAPAPSTVTAKYEGGYTAFTKKQPGTLTFDDASSRLVFRDKFQREYLSIPYAAMAAIWGDTRAVTSTTARVVSNVPLYGIGLTSLLMPKNKNRFLVVQFDDPDTKISGVTSFRLENKELLASVLHTLARKAAMKSRGDGFVRPAQSTDKQDKQDK